MKKSVKAVVCGFGRALRKRSPEILTGIGITGMITTTVLAVKATPKALKLIEKDKEDFGMDKLPPKDVVKATWKCYIPAAITGTLGVICLIGASATNHRRNAALATAYTLSESALREYREKVVETIGEKKEQAIHDEIVKEKVAKTPCSAQDVVITGKGETWCFDVMSGRRFKSDIEFIKKSVNELNWRLMRDGVVSLNDFYDLLGLQGTKMGDDLGWYAEKGLIELRFTSVLDQDNIPCLAIDYQVAPCYDYNKW